MCTLAAFHNDVPALRTSRVDLSWQICKVIGKLGYVSGLRRSPKNEFGSRNAGAPANTANDTYKVRVFLLFSSIFFGDDRAPDIHARPGGKSIGIDLGNEDVRVNRYGTTDSQLGFRVQPTTWQLARPDFRYHQSRCCGPHSYWFPLEPRMQLCSGVQGKLKFSPCPNPPIARRQRLLQAW